MEKDRISFVDANKAIIEIVRKVEKEVELILRCLKNEEFVPMYFGVVMPNIKVLKFSQHKSLVFVNKNGQEEYFHKLTVNDKLDILHALEYATTDYEL